MTLMLLMWVKQCFKPPMTGNGKFIPPIKMVMTGGWFIYLSVAELELLALTSATWNPE